jgi:hypothetical protein
VGEQAQREGERAEQRHEPEARAENEFVRLALVGAEEEDRDAEPEGDQRRDAGVLQGG